VIPVLTAQEMRAVDAHTISRVGVPGTVLMENAGRAVFERIAERYGDRLRGGPVCVVCGKGNNGGDGFVVARYLANRGCRVTAYLLGRREEVTGDAAVHLQACLGSQGRIVEVGEGNRSEAEEAVRRSALAVDAVLGTGLVSEVRGLAAAAIGWLSSASAPVISVDIPSGVSSDSGQVCGDAVRADSTVTFAYPKRGHFLHPGAALAGHLEIADIGIPPSALREIRVGLFCLEDRDFRGKLPRPPDGHKGTFGHLFVFGGGIGKTGAPGLAAWAALRSGVGLATVAWPAGLGGDSRLPLEVMTEPLPGAEPGGAGWDRNTWEAAAGLLERAAALAVGPGMGTGPGAFRFLEGLLRAPGPPAVLDADGLNLVSERPELWQTRRRTVVLTPHPGEAARLLGKSPADVQADRLGAIRELVGWYGCPVILKGAGTLVAEPGSEVFLVPKGNPGMATAGSGDVLSGVVGALLARGLTPLDACRLGAYTHALAGDLAARRAGADGLVASDISENLPQALKLLAAEPVESFAPARRTLT